MVIDSCLTERDRSGTSIAYEFRDQSGGEIVATAENNAGSYIQMMFRGENYEFCGRPAL